MPQINFREFESRDAMVEALTADCREALTAAVTEKGRASFLVSGGSSPAPAYENLSKSDLPWDKIDVALVDERWVDEAHPGSNEAFVKRTLLQNNAAGAKLVGMKNASVTAKSGLAECEAAFAELSQPFDVTILGMGPDGHTASFFPYSEGLEEALEGDSLCAAITAKKSEVTGDNLERMTVTMNALKKSRELKLLISGAEKLEAFKAAEQPGDVKAMPVRAVLEQNEVPVTVYWAP